MLFHATPRNVSLGDPVHFKGEFRRGISPVSGARVLIYRVDQPDELVSHAIVEHDGDFSDYWVSNKLGTQRFYSICPSPSAQSPPSAITVSPTKVKHTYVFPSLGPRIDRLISTIGARPPIKTVELRPPIKPVKRPISKPLKVYI